MQEQGELTYSQALSEIEQIVNHIETQEIDLDSLTAKVKRASELIIFCRNRLRQTEEEVDRVLEEKGLTQGAST